MKAVFAFGLIVAFQMIGVTVDGAGIECVDRPPFCADLKRYCFISWTLTPLLNLACPKTCGFCDAQGNFPCKDFGKPGNNFFCCAVGSDKKLCQGTSFAAQTAQLLCRKTCNLCGNSTTVTTA